MALQFKLSHITFNLCVAYKVYCIDFAVVYFQSVNVHTALKKR